LLIPRIRFDMERFRPGWPVYGLAAAALLAGTLWLADACYSPEALPYSRPVSVSSRGVCGTLDAALKSEGLDAPARYRIAKLLYGKLDPRRLRPEDSYTVAFSTWGKMLSFSLVKDLKNYFIFPERGGNLRLSVIPVWISTASVAASGEISSSLWESMSAKGVPPAVILDYADIFSWSVDFLTEVRDGDRWSLNWTQASDPAGRLVSQRIKAAAYKGAETGHKAGAFYSGAYYDEKGESLRSMFLRAPLHYRRISSYFTNRRYHPVLKYYRPHHGIDYAAPTGTPVSAVADGTVSFTGWKGGNGKLVIVRHSLGYETTYGHLSRYAKGIKKGRRMKQGAVIGYVGTTGLSTGPHLDFRVKLNGKPLDFLKIKYRSSGVVKGKAREAVRAAIKKLP